MKQNKTRIKIKIILNEFKKSVQFGRIFLDIIKISKSINIGIISLFFSLAMSLGWKNNWEIKEIQGDKYIYNPKKYEIGGTDMDRFEFDAYKIGQKLDSEGDIFKALIVCPAKDYFDEGLTDSNAIISDDNGSLCLYNDKPNHPDGGRRGRMGIIEPLDMRFMKDIIETRGVDDNAITNAIEAIRTVKEENPKFAADLLKSVMNSDEYKDAYDKSQNKSKEIAR